MRSSLHIIRLFGAAATRAALFGFRLFRVRHIFPPFRIASPNKNRDLMRDRFNNLFHCFARTLFDVLRKFSICRTTDFIRVCGIRQANFYVLRIHVS